MNNKVLGVAFHNKNSYYKTPNRSRLPEIELVFEQEQGSSYYISPHSTKNRCHDTETTILGTGEPTCYFHRQFRSVVVPSGDILNLPQCQHAFCHAPKDSMLSVQERCRCGSNEELHWVNSRRRDLRKLGLTWQPFVFGPEFACKVKGR